MVFSSRCSFTDECLSFRMEATALLIASILKLRHSSVKEQRELNTIYFSMMNEIKKLQEQNRLLELDIEILAKNAELKLSPAKRKVLRNILDLHRRGYSVESIAKNTDLNEKEVINLLTPYTSVNKEGA